MKDLILGALVGGPILLLGVLLFGLLISIVLYSGLFLVSYTTGTQILLVPYL